MRTGSSSTHLVFAPPEYTRRLTAEASFRGTDFSLPRSSSSCSISSPEKLRLISPGVCHLELETFVLFPNSRVPLLITSVLVDLPTERDIGVDVAAVE
jgi:hypothetical protein